MLAGITIGLLILLVLIAVLLAIPASIVLEVERAETLRASWRVHWLFGLVHVRSGARRQRGAKTVEPVAEPARPRRGPPFRHFRTIAAVLRTRGFVSRFFRLVRDLLGRVHYQRFHLHTEFGFDDPADTGRLYGALAPVVLTAAGCGLDIRVRPNFVQPCLLGSGGITVRFRPIEMVGAILAFVCSLPALRAARAIWRSRR